MKRHHTQWAAQFAVASELCKLGYDVSFTMGHNTPEVDLLALSPKTKSIVEIDVKGQKSRNFWRIKDRAARAGLFYVLALVQPGRPNEFFVMNEADVRREQKLYRESGVKYDPRFAGFNWGACKPYGGPDCWSRLPP